ncbi:hypothetical protein [Kribbella sp. NPDC049227]|uniref:hypothetical protein n=1 Tax=Kribbella sp. NPDC049227 TaxID=3364113 RepID=UPI00371E1157
MNGIFKGVRPSDYVLAVLMTAAGAFLMYGNIEAISDDLPHAQSSTSWAMLPAFVLVTLPILWRRRNIVAVVVVTAVATIGHVLAFGWNTRCGVVLPLAFALAYAVARFAGAWTNHVIALAGIVVLEVAMLARDASIDKILSGLALALPITGVFYGLGLLVQNRVEKQSAGMAPATERAAV